MDPLELVQNAEWRRVLQPEFAKPYFLRLWQFLQISYQNQIVFPPQANLFQAFAYKAPADLRAVIIGQDPYHGAGQADGLAFSVQSGVRMPPSLKNIYKALARDLAVSPPAEGSLHHWAEQGVLLLNTVLTVEEGRPGSHQRMGWEKFTDAVIRIVCENNSGCAFLCWGSAAAEKCRIVENTEHLLLQAVHPSPLSAYRGFLNCGHFSHTNSYLKSIGKPPVCW